VTVWVDVIARARGLRTHRLGPAALDALAREPDLAALGRALRQAGFPVEEGEHRAAALDLAIRRRAAAELRILARWCGPRAAALTIVFDEEDRRSLRALIRGAIQGAPSDTRLAGLVPTPTLPERALVELAEAPGPGAVVTLLAVWNHPFASALRGAATATVPDPLRFDNALNREWARRAIAGARRGGSDLRSLVSETIDIENAMTAVAVAGASTSLVGPQFLNGGRRVDLATYASAAHNTRAAALRLFEEVFAGTGYESGFRPVTDTALDDRLLSAHVRTLRAAARRTPLGPALVLWYAWELRAETIALSRTVWGIALEAPPEMIVERGRG
jgi:vacuolar-type H+-ATPase subunit C/Vma6